MEAVTGTALTATTEIEDAAMPVSSMALRNSLHNRHVHCQTQEEEEEKEAAAAAIATDGRAVGPPSSTEERVSWREFGELPSQIDARRQSDLMHDKIQNTVRVNYSKTSMRAKSIMLQGLNNYFVNKAAKARNSQQESTDEKQLLAPRNIDFKRGSSRQERQMLLSRWKFQRRLEQFVRNDPEDVGQLVQIFKSPRFRIDGKPDQSAGSGGNLAHRLAHLSCYDTQPRDPQPLERSGQQLQSTAAPPFCHDMQDERVEEA